MTTTTAYSLVPDAADVLAAGREYPPLRRFPHSITGDTARLVFAARRDWWLDAAAGWLRIAEAAPADQITETATDVRRALAAADYYTPAPHARTQGA